MTCAVLRCVYDQYLVVEFFILEMFYWFRFFLKMSIFQTISQTLFHSLAEPATYNQVRLVY